MAWQPKPKPCKICGVIGHTALNCYARRRRVLKRGVMQITRSAGIRRIGKSGNKWLKFRTQWFEDNPPDATGFYHCYYCAHFNLSSSLTRREATLDHWYSRTRRPELKFESSNIVVACYFHNKDKGSRSGEEYIELLRQRMAEAQTP